MTPARKLDAEGEEDILQGSTSLNLNGPPQRL
jgi:hypothetical protein